MISGLSHDKTENSGQGEAKAPGGGEGAWVGSGRSECFEWGAGLRELSVGHEGVIHGQRARSPSPHSCGRGRCGAVRKILVSCGTSNQRGCAEAWLQSHPPHRFQKHLIASMDKMKAGNRDSQHLSKHR